MMQKNERMVLLYCLLMCLTTGTVLYLMNEKKEKKIAVVDAVRLFNDFNMKTELENLSKMELIAEGKKLDSIDKMLQLAKAVDNTETEGNTRNLAYSYNNLKNKLDEDYRQSNRDINEKVWKRLNPLLIEYGKQEGLHLIIGANGMGTVLYNDAFYDKTSEVIKFVNRKYAEGN